MMDKVSFTDEVTKSKDYSRNQKQQSALHLKNQGTTLFDWTSGIVGSAIALGLIVSTPAWGIKAVVSKATFAPPPSPASHLTTVVPPILPPETWNSLVEKSVINHREILFIDLGVTDYQSLTESLSRNVEIVYLNSNEDGVAVIAAHLNGRRDLQGIHIVSHGGPGRLLLGDTVLTADTINNRRLDLVTWSQSLGPEGDVLLYGCEVAKGIEGIRFVNRLTHTLNVAVSASDDLTGSPTLGGDWTLEYHRNSVTKPLFASSVAENFHSLLVPGLVIAGDGSGGGGGGGGGSQVGEAGDGGSGGLGGGGADTLTGSTGNDVIFGDGAGGGGGGGGGDKYGSAGGSKGLGGSGSDTLSGGDGNDILFGDGFDGQAGEVGNKYGGGSGNSGFGIGGNGGIGQDTTGQNGSAGDAGFGGALGGTEGAYSYNGTATDGGSGGDGVGVVVYADDTGGALHTDASNKITSGYFSDKEGGSGNDILDGGSGSDALFGMGGTNIFVFEANDAISGNDIDTLYDWNKGINNRIKLTISGKALSEKEITAILGLQTGGVDRSIIHTHGNNEVTITVKDLNRSLDLTDFILYRSPWPMFLPAIIAPK